MTTKKRLPSRPAPAPVKEAMRRLDATYPGAGCSLEHRTPLQLLMATILSAQCTDARVNVVTPELFRRFPDAKSLAEAPGGALEDVIRSTGFFNSKAKSIRGTARAIVEKHGGEVPRSMAELHALPGVGRKTANVVLGNVWNTPEGVVVDTHVGRLARRFAWTKQTDPVKVEQDLNKLVPKDRWTWISHALILHGRARCLARKPKCEICVLADICPKIGVQEKEEKEKTKRKISLKVNRARQAPKRGGMTRSESKAGKTAAARRSRSGTGSHVSSKKNPRGFSRRNLRGSPPKQNLPGAPRT